MSMYDTADTLHKECMELFPDNGIAAPQRLTLRQIWFIVKVAKGVRLYCRSNKAFNNFFDSIFKGVAVFEQVVKVKPGGDKYEGLQITMAMPDGSELSSNGDGDDERY